MSDIYKQSLSRWLLAVHRNRGKCYIQYLELTWHGRGPAMITIDGQALAAALGVPDHAALTVTLFVRLLNGLDNLFDGEILLIPANLLFAGCGYSAPQPVLR